MDLSLKIDHFLAEVILASEHSNEFLIGHCESGVTLTNTQEHILMLLIEKPLTNSDLAKSLNISQAAVTKAVKSLVSKGFLKSMKDSKDGRVTYFSLTEDALPIAQEHFRHHELTLGVYDSILSSYDTSEKEVIGRFLEQLRKELFKG
ncbi:zinc-dependent MarR family transcriptional regulator [Streptococcus loxodontisalivarius]|uniref:DNA-binding MarR family transcriptional regulator n=1 Tax=Streptococcus loxodontisalivarius TaxID=1349415 RepID=A0ABS2PTZ0_9STRE|nr:zinc-dependent MarR family transcriptional regulator [Streptococcus loxodontisalivarius]MBM7643388.1 DNA-binding MarR family transcriptional regulator [Streptococcus loxodontisalivarius]